MTKKPVLAKKRIDELMLMAELAIKEKRPMEINPSDFISVAAECKSLRHKVANLGAKAAHLKSLVDDYKTEIK